MHVEITKLLQNTFHTLSSYLICSRTSTSTVMMMIKTKSEWQMRVINSETRVHIVLTCLIRCSSLLNILFFDIFVYVRVLYVRHVTCSHVRIFILFFFIFKKMNFLWHLQENERCPKTTAIQSFTCWKCEEGRRKSPKRNGNVDDGLGHSTQNDFAEEKFRSTYSFGFFFVSFFVVNLFMCECAGCTLPAGWSSLYFGNDRK